MRSIRERLGNTALVVGGSSGIGLAIATELMLHGLTVAIASRDEADLRDAEAQLRRISSRVLAVQCDITRGACVARLIETVQQYFGCPDIVVNSAGFATYETVERTPVEQLEEIIDANFTGAVRVTRGLIPGMIARRSGSIVNIASIAGVIPLTPNGTYSAAKHALVAWSSLLGDELEQFGIHVATVCPTRVLDTKFFDHPTFKARTEGPETRLIVPARTVARFTVRAIVDRRRLTYVPPALAIVPWLHNLLPFVSRPLLRRVVRRRLASVYGD